ncbi:MAG: sigma-70 family RNA polymerase sigma factor [Paucibacter sp.]|nr:sigma-70 family RNA polymerase sigma factor [Roseateles sp.]
MSDSDTPLHATANGARQVRNEDLRAYKPLVRAIAGQLRAQLAGNISFAELEQAGLIGLAEALARFESGQGATFETYASRRIRGAMLDELRLNDTLDRGARGRFKKLTAAVQRLEHRLGRVPRSKEVAAELGWSLEELHDCMVEAGAGARREGDTALDDADLAALAPTPHGADEDEDHPLDEQQDPQRATQQRQRMAALHAAFDALDEIERYVMEAVYTEGREMKDVGRELGVSGQRISQMSAAIMFKLRERLQGY